MRHEFKAPFERVRDALVRLSRERWVPPDELRQTAVRWMEKFHPLGQVRTRWVNAALGRGWEASGIYRGQPLLDRDDPANRRVIRWLQEQAHRRTRRPDNARLEAMLLNTLLKEKGNAEKYIRRFGEDAYRKHFR